MPWTDENLNPFSTSKAFAVDVKDNFVKAQLDRVMAIVGDGTNVLATAIGAIESLQTFDFSSSLPDYTEPNLVYADVIGSFAVPGVLAPNVFGVLESWDTDNDIDISGLPTISAVNIPTFSPTQLTIQIPSPPDPISVTKPGSPPVNPGFTFPDEITVVLPGSPDLINLTIPETPTVTLPELSLIYPVFSDRDVNTGITFTEPTYDQQVIDSVITQIETFFAGGSGIDPLVEENIFARSRDREDRTTRQQEMQAIEEWAQKGYTAPPGMLVKRIDNIREENTLKKLGLNREQTIKVFDTEIENLRFAVQQGIAAEQLFIQLFLARVARLFEIQKLSVQWEIELYNVSVAIFQAKMQEVQIRASVYETQVKAALVEIEIFKALLEAEQTKTQMNLAKIEAYKAEIQARVALVDMYKSQVQAVAIEADVFKTETDAYKTTVDAYSAEVNAESKRFDAYATQIQGEVSKVGLIEAEARAYQAEVQGIEVGVRAEVAGLQGAVSALEVEIRNYEAQVQSKLGKSRNQLDAIQANATAHGIDVQRKNLEISAEETTARLGIATIDSANRTNADIERNSIAAYVAKLEVLLEQVKLNLGAISSAGQLASTISAGALAAAHVGATVSGSGGMNATGSENSSWSNSTSKGCSTNTSITYEADAEPDMGVCG